MHTERSRNPTGISAALRRCESAYEQKATALHLSGFGLYQIPELIFRISSLTFLDLSGNFLSEVPGAIATLTALEVLQLQSNALTWLPHSLASLIYLKRLDVSHNHLRTVPDEIGSCTALRELLINDNPPVYDQTRHVYVPIHIPDTISSLTRLEKLSIAGNSLVDIPDGLFSLSSLTALDLSRNRIVRIPDDIANLTCLAHLDIRDNALATLPRSLLRLTSLTTLSLHGNSRLHLPMEILGPVPADVIADHSRPAIPQYILNYYFHIATEAHPLNEAKLILVGFGDVGKTSLINRLLYNTFLPQQSKTEGINITDWVVSVGNDEKARLHIWDFGGQEIMHAIHQFFLTSRSLYVLVLNGRQGQENMDAEYWLTIINSFAGECPVIVVLNKIGISMVSIARKALQAAFPNIACFVETDCRDNIGIEELRTAIRRETDTLPHLRDAFPATWYSIKETLSAMRENFLTFDRYQAMCRTHGEENNAAQAKLASFLHNIGVVLHYANEPRLNYTHVLNPGWVTTGIYKVINSAIVQANRGVVSCADLIKILDHPDYPKQMHMFFIELMRKFELCFPFSGDADRYLIPDLLENDEGDAVSGFCETDCLLFEYRYPVLPEGLVPRFITRTYALSENQPRWRYGTVLEFEGSKAIVKGDPIKRRVRIAVQGRTAAGRRRLLGVLNAAGMENVLLPDTIS